MQPVKETVYVWDGGPHLSVLGEPWWHVETDVLDDIAHAILHNQTDDRKLADARAKEYAANVLRPLRGMITHIAAREVEWWLLSSPRPVGLDRHMGPAWIPCARCTRPLFIPSMHRDIVETFGTLCAKCRGGLS